MDTAISFLIPKAAVGTVIGKGGQHLTQLQQQYDAKVQINKECEPGTEENNVTLVGRLADVQKVHHKIIQYVARAVLLTQSGVVGRWYQATISKRRTARARLYRSQILQANTKYSLESS